MPARKPPLSLRKRAIIVGLILGGIVVAHIGLWRSDMPQGEKLMRTIFNAESWTVILAPILLIDHWLKSVERRNRDGQEQCGPGLPPDT